MPCDRSSERSELSTAALAIPLGRIVHCVAFVALECLVLLERGGWTQRDRGVRRGVCPERMLDERSVQFLRRGVLARASVSPALVLPNPGAQKRELVEVGRRSSRRIRLSRRWLVCSRLDWRDWPTCRALRRFDRLLDGHRNLCGR